MVAVSNEGRELNDYRIRTFKLDGVIDFFVTSCYVGLRKPDPAIFRMAADLAQAPPSQTVYLDDREPLAEVAAGLGMRAIHHKDFPSTCRALQNLGLYPRPQPVV